MSMDEDEVYADERDEILNRFRQSLGKPMSERFFDEDDLIEVFDYAGDLNDDYLRLEVLMCGARFFPDSEALLERRGIFYSQYSDDARSEFLSDNPADGNRILEMLEIRSADVSLDEKKKLILKLIDSADQFVDEEMIQIIDLISSLGLYQWLKELLPKLRTKTDYVNIVLYEVAIAADLNGDHAFSAKMLEELTELVPFNSYYWMQLAKQYNHLHDEEKALSAIDYSLAIKPDSPDAILVKATLLYSMEKPADEVVDFLNKSISEGNGIFESAKLLATIYDNEGKRDVARQIMSEALVAFPEREIEIIPDLLLLGADDPDTLLDRYFVLALDKTQLAWATWAQQLSLMGYPELARKVLKCFKRNTGINIPSVFDIEDAFVQQKFQETIEKIDTYLKEIGRAESEFPLILTFHLISLVKIGDFDHALSMCKFILYVFDISSLKSVSMRMEYLSLRAIAVLISDLLEKGQTDWNGFDPLGLWGNAED